MLQHSLSAFSKSLLFLVSITTQATFCNSLKYGLAKISSKNYEQTILNGEKNAWILAVKDVGKIPLEQWLEVEFRLRGLNVRVGIIDPQKDGAFLKRKVSWKAYLEYIWKTRKHIVTT